MPTTTTNFAWTIPSDTDLVKDGASAIRTIGNAVDASFASVTLRAVTTTSDTFVLADLRNKLVTYSNAAAIAVTIPLNSSVAFPIGTINQYCTNRSRSSYCFRCIRSYD
jgi:hypothetical protein